MTSKKNLLSLSPEELQQPKRGITRQQDTSKQTYILIIKQEENLSQTTLTGSRQESFDSLRQNLSNIGDGDYDSGISAANLFLKDESEDLVLPSAKRSRIYEDPPPRPPPICVLDQLGSKGIVKRNLFASTLSPITPDSENFNGSIITNIDSPQIVQVKHEVYVNNTPTPSLDNKEHPAVRQIFLVSPPQYQTSPSAMVTSSVAKVLYAPSPLASSTPVTCELNMSVVPTTSPDSGISLSVSSLSSASIQTSDQSIVVLPPMSAAPEMVPSSVTTKQAGPGLPIETKITFSRLPVPLPIEPELSDDGDKSLDTSLANIQWLGGLQWGEKMLTRRSVTPTVATRWTSEERGRRKEYNLDEIIKVNRECGKTKRPPYSYMVLIQMALQSRDDQKMTLREICRWIEETFAFYKWTSKKGWKNSIRHNLSYYQCFVRTNEDKKKHGARWTLQFKDEKAGVKPGPSHDACPMPGIIPVFIKQHQHSPNLLCAGSTVSSALLPLQSTPGSVLPVQTTPGMMPFQQFLSLQACLSRKRTGPTPILPRPTPVQAYALVPLHNLQQQQQLQQQQPAAVNSNPVLYSMPSHQQHMPSSFTAIKDGKVPIPAKMPLCRKKIISATPLSADPNNVNILRQAWLNACISEDDAPPPKCELLKVVDKRRRNNSKCKIGGVSTGLPKPTLYAHKPKKRTRSRVKKQAKLSVEKGLLVDSTDSEPDDQFETGLPTPLKQLFQSPDEKNTSDHLTTSTPLRNSTISLEHLPSPIRGLTPLRNSCGFDGSFLDILQEEAIHALKLIGSPQGDLLKTGQSPNTSLTEFGIFQISPDKGNKNLSDCHFQGLSRIFADFDANFITDADGLPVDMTTFNWSGLQTLSSPKDKNNGDKS